MIKFFRKFRQKLISENNFSKYLIYAIGEIILVVIGILIALNINNANEMRKNEKEINSILKQVRSELLANINEADRIMRFYMKKDSIINLVKTGQVSYDDYKNNTIEGLTFLASSSIQLNIQNDAYLDLMNNVKNAPESLDTIISELKLAYITHLKEVELANNMVIDAVLDFTKWKEVNTTWSGDYYFTNRTASDEEINFYLQSPYYKNVVTKFYVLGIENHYETVAMLRYRLYKCYNKITNSLNSKGKKTLNLASFPQNKETYKTYLGTYVSETDTLKIFIENDEYVMHKSNSSEKRSIIAVNKSSFITSPGYFFYLKFDENGKVIGLTSRVGYNFIEYVKMV